MAFFEELGANAQRGRVLSLADQKPGQNFVAVLSDSLWRTRFGADPAILGRTLVLDKQPYTIVGVAARNFSFPEKNDVWIPVAITPDIENQPAFFMFQLLGKLRRGQKITQLNAELATIAQRLIKDSPVLKSGLTFTAEPLLESRVQYVRTAYLILLGASTLVLLIACANLSSLLLARGSARQREMALRAALGASRGRLLRQGLVESCLIALLGGALGMLLAAGGVELFRGIAPIGTPRLNEISVDSTLLLFSLFSSLIAGLIFGLAPARRAARMDPNEALKEGTGTSLGAARTAHQSKLGKALVVVEVALAFILLIGSALMTQTVYNLLHQNPGFRTDHLLSFDLPTPPIYDDPGPAFVQQYVARLKRTVEQVQLVPGVAAVTASDHALLTGMNMMQAGLDAEGALPPKTGEQRYAKARYVYPSYFQTLGMPLLSGKDFTDRDTQGSPRVIIVNDAMAREYWGSSNVLGKHIGMFKDEKRNREWYEVIGVVSDVREINVSNTPDPEYYLSMLQGGTGSMNLFVRTLCRPGCACHGNLAPNLVRIS